MNEFIYTIDKEQSGKDGVLAIKIQEAQRKGLELIISSNQRILSKSYLNSLMTARDSPLLTFLIKEEIAYIKKTSGKAFDERQTSFNVVHIHPNAISEAFKLLVINGKLFFNGKPLVIDLYGKTEFYYTNSAQDSSKLEGRIKTASDDFPLAACDYIGRGLHHWFIKGVRLMSISTDISWKDLNSAYTGCYRCVKELMEEAEQDAEVPRVIISNAITASEPLVVDPLPVLILKDRLGSFADLWMDYKGELRAFGDSKGQINQKAEAGWEKDLLETDYIKKAVGTSNYYCPLDKVTKSIAFLLEIGWQVRDWQERIVHLHTCSKLTAETTHTQEIVIKGKIEYGDYEADVTNIIGAFNRRERFALLAPGHVALLPTNLEQPDFDMLADEGMIIEDGICIQRTRIGALSSLFDSQPGMRLDPSLTNLKEKLADFKGINTTLPSESFLGTLRPYQQKGVNWLAFLHAYGFHGMLADDMGLGKTVQVLAFLSTLKVSSPCLIIVPTSLIFNWKREIERFLPAATVYVHHGSQRAASIDQLQPFQILLTTYATTRLDAPLLKQLSYACLILDEAQAIKNAHTQTFQTVTALKADFRLSITGTPIENSLNELWAHFRFLIPDLFGEEEAFQAEIQAASSDSRYLKRIKKKITPFLMRRSKEEVAPDLPEKIEQIVWIEMGEKQRAAYEAFLSSARRRLIDSNGLVSQGRMEILEAIMRLRQLCCHPLLVTATTGDECAESAKIEVLLEDIETAILEKRKVLVYSQFTSMLSLIARRLKEKGWRYVYLDGQTQNREQVVSQFQNDADIPLFLISLKAGGVGLNLTAADYVFLYDPWWNDAAENQAINRAHRIGRKDTVIAKRYVMAESIEERIMKLKASKSSLAADLFDEGSMQGSLNADDLLFLLG